jgi:hypothetical protein
VTTYPDGTKPNHYQNDSLGDPAVCTEDHNHPETVNENGVEVYVETPNLPSARLEWFDRSPNRKIGSVNGHVVYVIQWKALDTEFKIFHRLPVKQIDQTFKTSDEAKLFADTHLHRAMRVLGFVAR